MLFAGVIVITLLIAGDVIVASLGIPVPGAVLALLALASLCATSRDAGVRIPKLFDAVIPHAPMLFVPAAVGVIANVPVIASAWMPIVSAITLSTAATLIVAGHALQMFLRLFPDTRPSGG